MKLYEPVTLAMPLAKRIGELILEKGRLPEGDEIREFMREFGLEESCLDRGMAIYRTKFLVALAFPRGENVVIDVISSSGELSDALEVIAYRDRELGAFVVEILPANDLEYEGNIGIEPIIIDEKTLEPESNPVLGHFEEDSEGLFLVIDRETYSRWRKNGDPHTCPICGGELAWKGEKAYCRDCGYGVRVVKG
ncbi:transposase [Thermococcus aciditolerans]|uniref:Transposase n=1 Tax=Thermococcus aciditolerans TaxID=2598455 RepID=A0A5C0SLT2_9EURY|nr:transposase [Thermococcus aciditolerans]QEK15280.1 transposase [Thermococcus aciditolerans]